MKPEKLMQSCLSLLKFFIKFEGTLIFIKLIIYLTNETYIIFILIFHESFKIIN